MELSDGGCFPNFGAELPPDNITPTVILNNPVYRGHRVNLISFGKAK
jgi:hypothetical protein